LFTLANMTCDVMRSWPMFVYIMGKRSVLVWSGLVWMDGWMDGWMLRPIPDPPIASINPSPRLWGGSHWAAGWTGSEQAVGRGLVEAGWLVGWLAGWHCDAVNKTL
jgi:hypothetical protein